MTIEKQLDDMLLKNLPDCSEPDDRYPNYINAMLRDIKRYRHQQIDPAGYRAELAKASEKAGEKKIKGN